MNADKSKRTKKISVIDRVLLLITGLLAAYQIGFGINAVELLPVVSYTVAFGVLLVAGLLIIILGFEVLDSPAVVIVSTLIPLSLSMGLVAEHIQSWLLPYFVFVILGLILVTASRFVGSKLTNVILLAVVHGISGLVIFLLPILRSIAGAAPSLFSFVGIGGALIGVGGLLLSFQKMGKPILSREMILSVLPSLLLLMAICFVVGFSA